jgi:hypothetical protein
MYVVYKPYGNYGIVYVNVLSVIIAVIDYVIGPLNII